MTMSQPRDYDAERWQAAELVDKAEQNLQRARVDCQQTLQYKEAWLAECHRRLSVAERRAGSAPKGASDGDDDDRVIPLTMPEWAENQFPRR